MGPVFWLIMAVFAVKVPALIIYRVCLWRDGYRFRTVYDWRGRRRTIRYNIHEEE